MTTPTNSSSAPSAVRAIFDTMSYGPAPEGDSPVRQWLDARDRRFGHYIGGRFVRSEEQRLNSSH